MVWLKLSINELGEKGWGMQDVDLKRWLAEGYYILPGFYSHEEMDVAAASQLKIWEDRHPRIVVDDMVNGARKKLSLVTAWEKENHRFKLNDLYLEVPEIRSLAVNSRISPILKTLLGHAPVLCNSLSFEQGSGQPDHVDSLYMTPQTDGHLIAIWIAMEDCHPNAGPLRYYPGSNAIPSYIFSNGSRHVVESEMSAWNAYINEQLQLRDLKAVTFPAKKGDVFIWSCNLLHGGSPLNDVNLTRRSLVFHYYSDHDCKRAKWDIRPEAGAYWMYRAHQSVDGAPGAFPPN